MGRRSVIEAGSKHVICTSFLILAGTIAALKNKHQHAITFTIKKSNEVFSLKN